MKNRVSTGLAVVCVSLWAVPSPPANAQSYDYVYTRPGASLWQGHVMGGYSATSGAASDYLQGGWALDAGVTFWPGGGQVGIRGDVGYSAHNVTNQFIDVGQAATGELVNDGSGDFTSVLAGPVFRVPVGRGAVYALAQAGFAHVHMELDQTFYIPGYYCDPFFGYCGYDYGLGSAEIYNYSTNKFSWDVGLGVEFPSHWGQSWFIEAAYHRVETPQPLVYWPITVGVRF